MTASSIGVLGIMVLVLLFFTRMPVSYVMTLVGFLGFAATASWTGGLNLLAKDFYDVFSSYNLTTIPLFVLMGQIAFNAGISGKLYRAAYCFLGHTRGGLAIATSASCAAFGALCGSSPATAATMATVGLPEMRKRGYSDALAAGAVASGGGMGMIMPPSVVLIIYGILTEQSIGKLFMAGIIPALLVTLLFIVTIVIWCRIRPEAGPVGEVFSWQEKFRSLAGVVEPLAIFLLVVGSIFYGVCTATEAAGLGVVCVLVVSVSRRQLNWPKLIDACYDTMKTSCMIMLLVAGATVFGKFLAVTRIPYDIASWIGGFDLHPSLVFSLVILVYLIGGCFMDSLALVMLTVPVFFPLVMGLGFDPIWFGVVIVMVTEMGVITPPVGLNVYVVYGVAQGLPGTSISLEEIFKGVFPFMLAVLLGIALMLFFPSIILFLPTLMR
ncbi:MAG: TRAP transporter large permease [Desulfobulbaceae bacterium]|jgi:tripartite ATP-independent transporter DctM subunit|nr:TRAP transporter large permease [Desulfobulbaceae bacterium]